MDCKRAILLESIKKGLTALEFRNTHPFFCISPKVYLVIKISHGSESRVLSCDNGVFWMDVITFSWLYLGFPLKFTFYW